MWTSVRPCFEVDRLKTGTPARVDSRSIDYRGLEVQEGGTANSYSLNPKP
jgi:tRNA uridine 5-carboxymethylaminomethyl modification enzyme